MNNLQHFSVLKNNINVCYDITTATSNSLVNGSALFYNQKTDNIKSPTGFGMFKDKIGNLIIVADEYTKQSKTLMKGELFGFSSWEDVKRNCPIIWQGTTTKNVWGKVDLSRTERAKLINKGQVYRYLGNWGNDVPPQKNLFEALESIESKGITFDNPIIVWWNYEQANGIDDILIFALSIASSFAGPLNISPEIFEKASNLVKVWGKGNSLASYNNIFDTLAMTSEILLPEWTKGANAKIENAKVKFGKYLEQAKSGYNAIQSNLTDGAMLNQFVNITGVNRIEVQKFLQNIKLGQYANVVDLRKTTGSLANANKTFAGVNASFTNELVKIKMQGNKLLSDIQTTGTSAFDVPLINNIFQSGTASTILQGVIGADKIIPEVIKKERGSMTLNNLAGLISASFGYVGPEENFDNMTLNALISQAQSYAFNKIPFVLPDTIPISKRDKFADEIKKSAGVEVIGYQDKWDYDTNLRKMMPLGIAVAVGGLWYAKKKNIF